MSRKTTPKPTKKSPSITLADIEAAARSIADDVINTPMVPSRTLSQILGCKIWFKFENLQFTGSFKERGALNCLKKLTSHQREAGVIAMSAGNHAQAVAYHARRLNIPATIVMPEGTPTVKVENTRHHDADVIVRGATLEDSAAFAKTHGQANKLTLVHPYDDVSIIAGQGTISLEILKDAPDLDTLIVPIGGGGLASGMAIAAKALKPDIEIIGVEAELYPSMYNAKYGKDLPMRGDTLAEGIAVKTPGTITTPLVRNFIDDIVLVSEPQIERAVSLLLTIEKTVVEGAGAAGLAAIVAEPLRFEGKKVGLVLCGGNIDTRLLASVLTRELAREGRLSELVIDIPDRPGQLARVSQIIAGLNANIVEVYHQRVFTDLPAKGTELHVVVETRDREQLHAVVSALTKSGFNVTVRNSRDAVERS